MKCIVKNKSLPLLSLFFIACYLISCGSAAAPESNEDMQANSGSVVASVTHVETAIAEFHLFQYLISSNGKIKSQHEQLITSESSGKLLVCNAQTGKKASVGSVILQLETTSIQYRLQKAKLVQFNSEKEYESQLLGYENLLKDKTKEEADDIKQKLKISTGLAGAEQEIKEANYELTKAIIKAPFSGILADVKVQQGQQLKSGEELFRIYDPNNMLLEIKLLEADISMLKQGTPAEASPIINPKLIYKASVYEINPYVDENGMVTIRLKIQIPNSKSQNESSRLFPGMNCMAIIKVPFAKTLIVPKEAVVMRSGKAVVFTMEEGKAKWNYVVTGKDNGKEVEIKEGLKAGQKVITTNNLQLAHDAPIKEMSKEDNH